jgi:hypothetical protein
MESALHDLTPLHAKIVLERPDIDEVRDFPSLVVQIWDTNDAGINAEFLHEGFITNTGNTP